MRGGGLAAMKVRAADIYGNDFNVVTFLENVPEAVVRAKLKAIETLRNSFVWDYDGAVPLPASETRLWHSSSSPFLSLCLSLSFA